MSRALVIGAGLGGISAALRLRAKGFEVTITDKLDQLGGRARVFKQDGFTFDAGPTVITAPFLLAELFELFGKRIENYLELKDVFPWYRFRFSDGSIFDYGGSVEQTLEEIRKLSPPDVEGYRKLLKESERIFEIGFLKLSDQPFHQIGSLIKEIPHMLRLGAHRSVYQLVSKYLRDDRLRRAFSIQPLLVGGNPFDTTCIYSLIHYLERKWGVSYVMGGTGALVAALKKLMHEEGIEVYLNDEVVKFEGAKRLTRAVFKSGKTFEADLFVCNADPAFVYSQLVPQGFNKKWSSRRLNRLDYSMGLVVLYFGTRRQYPEVKHHTIVMGESYKELLESIFKKKRLSEDDMSLYLHRPTATDSSMAPEACDCFYVLSPVPNLLGDTDWREKAEQYKASIYERLEKDLMPELRKNIVTEKMLTPLEFQRDYNAPWGTGFSIAPRFSQSAYFRFHNKSEDFENLFFVGAGTHPGAGIPGVLSSSKVLDRLIESPWGQASSRRSMLL
jgi:phytoene desaturase